MPIELRPHQEEAIAKMHNGCVLYGGVGVGKTITSLAYYYTKVCNGELNKWDSMETPRDVYVITTAKVRDSQSFEVQAAQMGVHQNPKVSTKGVKIKVDSWNNVAKYKDVKDAFFIFDEQRVVGYGAWSKAFIHIAKHNQWVLLSATPGDTWLDYIPVFIANGYYRNKTDFTDQHVVWTPRVKYPKVLRYHNVGTLVRNRNAVLVHMPFTRTTVRHGHTIKCEYNEELFRKVTDKRWHVYENRPLRDVAELFSVMRKVVNSDASRLEAVGSLLQKHPKLIVFYNFDYELEMLRSLVPEDQLASPESLMDLKKRLDTSPQTRGSRSIPTRTGTTPSTSTRSDSSESLSLGKSRLASVSATSPSTSTVGSSDSPSSTRSQRLSGTQTTSPRPSTVNSGERWASSGTTGASIGGPSGTAAHATSEACSETPCTGHWTDDEGKGEVFYNCNAWDWLTSVEGLIANEECEPREVESFAVAEWNGHKHEPIPTTDRWVYLVQYRAGAEGWNCIETDAMVFFSQTYSYRDWWQAHGRIDRLNTPFRDLHYYSLISSSIIDKAIKKALGAKKSFNERSLQV